MKPLLRNNCLQFIYIILQFKIAIVVKIILIYLFFKFTFEGKAMKIRLMNLIE